MNYHQQNIIVYIKERQELEKNLIKQQQKLSKFLDSLQIIKDENTKHELKIEINKIKKNINTTKKNMDLLAKEEIDRSVIDKYIKLEKEMDTMLRECKAEEKILVQNEKAFVSIKKSIAKALISKKQRI